MVDTGTFKKINMQKKARMYNTLKSAMQHTAVYYTASLILANNSFS
jgi:hypothetical protein